MTRRSWALLFAGLLLAGGAASYAQFRSELSRQAERLEGQSRVARIGSSQIEYAVRGQGLPLLMIHGTGGGFDQVLTFSKAARGLSVIAPSRFGYLRSDFPADPSPERQGDAFAALLDHLEIDRVAVAGGSAGALAAVQFALRHPERTSALVLIVPAANVRGADPVKMSAAEEFMVRRLARSDFLFWAASQFARDRMIGTLLATDPQLVRKAPIAERRRAHRILEEIMPVSRRWRGMLNDGRLAGSPARADFSKIAVPTLVISVEDDRFGTAQTAREIAAAVPGARLLIYPDGGHIWIGHDAALWREAHAFVEHSTAAAEEGTTP
jgi:2-hydroxy-6-oxonona-2,4-dienedioate hydrolase